MPTLSNVYALFLLHLTSPSPHGAIFPLPWEGSPPCRAEPNPMSRRARYAVLLILVLVLVLGWAIWPRQPALVLYTSPHITLDKKTVQLQALVPEGWIGETLTITHADPSRRPIT